MSSGCRTAFWLLFPLLSLARAGELPVELDGVNFDHVVDGSRGVLVLFMAPWCGHCKVLKPTWSRLASIYHDTDLLAIATVDAEAHPAVAERFGVRGFPTIQWFGGGVGDGWKYTGGRSLLDFVLFLNKKTGLRRKIPQEPSMVARLDGANFKQAVDAAPVSMVKFFAPWCEHCQQMSPAFEQVAQTFQRDDEQVLVAEVDCDQQQELCSRHAISSFPTIRIYKRGKDGVPYEDGRSAAELVAAVNQHTSVPRMVGGEYSSMAGRAEELDRMVAGYTSLASPEQLEILSSLQRSELEAADLYVNLVTLALQKDSGWPLREMGRIERLLDSGAVEPKRSDRFVLRKNVLAALCTPADLRQPSRDQSGHGL